mmetsp:Transcript_32911/g.75220  ORF Transcript_32911/g.75220 Transcript_32911/m.75220 type:complete len:299 (-) Transcript_32911:1329-2225(-)
MRRPMSYCSCSVSSKRLSSLPVKRLNIRRFSGMVPFKSSTNRPRSGNRRKTLFPFCTPLAYCSKSLDIMDASSLYSSGGSSTSSRSSGSVLSPSSSSLSLVLIFKFFSFPSLLFFASLRRPFFVATRGLRRPASSCPAASSVAWSTPFGCSALTTDACPASSRSGASRLLRATPPLSFLPLLPSSSSGEASRLSTVASSSSSSSSSALSSGKASRRVTVKSSSSSSSIPRLKDASFAICASVLRLNGVMSRELYFRVSPGSIVASSSPTPLLKVCRFPTVICCLPSSVVSFTLSRPSS